MSRTKAQLKYARSKVVMDNLDTSVGSGGTLVWSSHATRLNCHAPESSASHSDLHYSALVGKELFYLGKYRTLVFGNFVN